MKIKAVVLEAVNKIPDKFNHINVFDDDDGTDMCLQVYKDGGVLSVRRPIIELNTVLICEITINPEGVDDIAGKVIVQSTQLHPSSADGVLSFRRKELTANDIPQNGSLPTYGLIKFHSAFQVLQAYVNMFIYDIAYYITDININDITAKTDQAISYYDIANLDKNIKKLTGELESAYPTHKFSILPLFFDNHYAPNIWIEMTLSPKELGQKTSHLNFLINGSSVDKNDRILISPEELTKPEYQIFPEILILTPSRLIREWNI